MEQTNCHALQPAGAAVLPNWRNSGGFTLIELLIYMMLIGFVIVVAGRVFSDSTSMRVRSQSMLASAEEAGRVSAILKEDISQMGARSWAVINANETNSSSSTDLSSYVLSKVFSPDSLDNIKFRKLHYTPTGICGPIMEIEWYVEGDVLKRKCRVISTPSECKGTFNVATDCPPEVEMASGVTKFKLLPSKPGISTISGSNADTLFPSSPPVGGIINFALKSDATSTTDASNVSLGPFTAAYNSSTSTAKALKYCFAASNSCLSFGFKADEEYAVEFDLINKTINTDPCVTGTACNLEDKYNPMTMFQAGRDHLSVGLRNPSGDYISKVPDFMFYPPQNEAVKIHFSFSVPSDAAGSTNTLTANIGITASFYSEKAYNGHLDFKNFKVYRKSEKVYRFDQSNLNYNPTATTTPNKSASVKAFELTFGIKRKNETSKMVIVIPVPNNGIAGGI